MGTGEENVPSRCFSYSSYVTARVHWSSEENCGLKAPFLNPHLRVQAVRAWRGFCSAHIEAHACFASMWQRSWDPIWTWCLNIWSHVQTQKSVFWVSVSICDEVSISCVGRLVNDSFSRDSNAAPECTSLCYCVIYIYIFLIFYVFSLSLSLPSGNMYTWRQMQLLPWLGADAWRENWMILSLSSFVFKSFYFSSLNGPSLAWFNLEWCVHVTVM